MFAEQDSTGAPPLTLHADLVPVTSADAPGGYCFYLQRSSTFKYR